MAGQRRYRKFTAQQKVEIVLAELQGDRSVREHEIAETLYYGWRDKLLEGGKSELAGKQERQAEREVRRRAAQLERKTYELELDDTPRDVANTR